MRTVSASARARVQSRLSTAAAALPFSSVLREVGMAFLPTEPSLLRLVLLFFFEVFGGYGGKSTRGVPVIAEVLRRPGEGVAVAARQSGSPEMAPHCALVRGRQRREDSRRQGCREFRKPRVS